MFFGGTPTAPYLSLEPRNVQRRTCDFHCSPPPLWLIVTVVWVQGLVAHTQSHSRCRSFSSIKSQGASQLWENDCSFGVSSVGCDLPVLGSTEILLSVYCRHWHHSPMSIPDVYFLTWKVSFFVVYSIFPMPLFFISCLVLLVADCAASLPTPDITTAYMAL